MFTRIGAGEIVFLGLLVGIVLIGTMALVVGFLSSRRERMLKHVERMKALELGRELPEMIATEPEPEPASVASVAVAPPESEASQFAGKCFSTAFWACFWGFLFAGQTGSVGSQAVAMMIAGATGAVGVTAVICGTVLASKAVAVARVAPVPSPSPVPAGYAAKPHFDREEV